MSTVAAVIVHYESDPEIFDCLRALSGQVQQVIVCNNASPDTAAERIASEQLATVVHSSKNLGFAAGANFGARTVTADYVLFINPDATPEPEAISTLAHFLDVNPEMGAVGPLVLNPDATVQPSKRRFPSIKDSILHGIVGVVWPNNAGTRRYLLEALPVNRPATVDWISGSAMMVRNRAFVEVGGFDEGYFFFVEDVDLCRRLTDAGWKIAWEPRAVVHHTWGRSWSERPLRFAWLHRRSLARYARKYSSPLLYPAVAVGLLLRFVLVCVRRMFGGGALPSHSRRKRK